MMHSSGYSTRRNRLCCQNVIENTGGVTDFHGKSLCSQHGGKPKTPESMTKFSHTLLLFSIFIRPNLCQDSTDKQKLKQDLLVAVMCVFLVLLIMLFAVCMFLHYKLITEDFMLKKELQSYATRARRVETEIILSSTQPNQLASLEWDLSLTPSQLPALPPAGPEPNLPGDVPASQNPRTISISHLYRSCSSESIHSNESGTVYSLEHFQCLYGSSRSGSRGSLDKEDQGLLQEEELEISNESGSIMLCAVHEM